MNKLNQYTQFKGGNPFGSQAKMLHHLDRLYEYVLEGDTTPIFIEFNLTDRCNLNCQWCISENCRSPATINKSVATRALTDFQRIGGKAVTFSGGGEPTFHPDFLHIAEHALKIGLDVGLMTNGIYPGHYNATIKKFNWVRISVDTLIPERYKKWKGKDRVTEVERNILELEKEEVRVGLNVNVSPDHTIEDCISVLNLSDYANYIQFRPVLPRYYKKEELTLNASIWSFLITASTTNSKINLSLDKLTDMKEEDIFPFDSCEGHFFNPIIHANGDVAVCMYHPNEEDYIFGNLNKKSFSQIWKSSKRYEVIDKLRLVDYKKCCQVCCKLTELNKLIQFISNPDDTPDINFL